MADAKGPEWGYRLKDGKIESKLFPEGRPKGWKDTPAGLKADGNSK